MKTCLVYCCVAVSLLCANIYAKAEDYVNAPANSFDKAHYISTLPAWVEAVPFNPSIDVPLDEISNGIYYITIDRQVRVPQDGEQHRVSRFVYKFVNDSGVEDNAQLTFDFDPRYERIQLHVLNIWRDGKKHSRLNQADMKILHQEDEKQNLIYDGRLSLNVVMDDLQVGDIVEYSYSLIGSNPIRENTFSFNRKLTWSLPVGESFVRILWGKDTPLYYKIDGHTSEDINVETVGEFTEYRYRAGPISSVLEEDNTPNHFYPWARAFFSEVESWQGIVDLLEPHYAGAVQLNDNIKQQAIKATLTANTDKEKVAAILRYVQDEVRYLGIEIAEGAFRPTKAGETLARAYGDCKDKTVLTISLLKAVGIESHPILVNTYQRQGLQRYLPAIEAFDHVIVYLELDGKVYWLDPTRKQQYGALDTIYQPNYEMGLILRPGEVALVNASFEQADTFVRAHDVYDLTQGVNAEALLNIQTVYGGYKAEEQRKSVIQSGLKEVQKSFYEFYQTYYSDMAMLHAVTFSDDEHKNLLTAQENYQVNNLWVDDVEEKEYDASFYAYHVSPYLKVESGASRQQPYYLSHPIRISQRIELQFNQDESWYFTNENFVEDNAFFNYAFTVDFNKEDAVLYLDYSYRSKQAYIAASDFVEYLAAIKRAKDNINYSIFMPHKKTVAEAVVESSTVDLNDDEKLVYLGILVYLLLFALLLYFYFSQKRLSDARVYYYPVSAVKFFIMYFATAGVYVIYWFYKNWQFHNNQHDKSVMPFFRALFYPFWFYALFLGLKSQNDALDKKIKAPSTLLVVMSFIVFWVTYIASAFDYYWLLMLVVSSICFWPLVSFINRMNAAHDEAYYDNSRWRASSVLAMLLASPLLVVTLGSSVGLMPSEKIVAGNKLLQRDTIFMQRKNLISADDEIIYFYSDGYLSSKTDGNGFTDRHVFSYWREDDVFYSEQANYDEISDIKVKFSESWLDTTAIEVIKHDKSSFFLYVSAMGKKDKEFVKGLKSRWQAGQL